MRKLFSANPARMGRFDGPPVCDAVPASMIEGSPGHLKADLIDLLGKANVLHRAISYGTPQMRARIGSSLKLSCCLEQAMTSSSSSATAERSDGTRRFVRRARVSTANRYPTTF
jgi:hypothetical protein